MEKETRTTLYCTKCGKAMEWVPTGKYGTYTGKPEMVAVCSVKDCAHGFHVPAKKGIFFPKYFCGKCGKRVGATGYEFYLK